MAHTTPLSVHKQLDNGLKLLTKIHVDEVQVGTTPKDLVFEIDKVRLFRYRPLADKASGAAPVLVAYGMVGRYTMADLQPDRSLIRNLLAQGLTVYVVDWGNPNRADRWLSFEDYVEDYLGGCVQHILREHSITSLNLLGICEGGVLTMCYAALHPAEVRNLILTITPVDFHADRAEGRLDRGFINLWTRSVDEGDIQRVIDSYGYIPGKFMGLVFSMITPAKTLTKYNLDLAEVFEDEDRLRNFLRMEQWLADRPHHPGEAGARLLHPHVPAQRAGRRPLHHRRPGGQAVGADDAGAQHLCARRPHHPAAVLAGAGPAGRHTRLFRTGAAGRPRGRVRQRQVAGHRRRARRQVARSTQRRRRDEGDKDPRPQAA